MLRASARNVVSNDATDLPPLAHTCAIAQKEAGSSTPRKHELVSLASVLYALELQGRQLPLADDVGPVERIPERIGCWREINRSKSSGLGYLGRVRNSKMERATLIVVIDVVVFLRLKKKKRQVQAEEE